MSILTTLWPIFTATVLPVFLVAAAGYVLTRFVPMDGRTLGRLLFFLATPSLVFRSLYTMKLNLLSLGHVAAITVGVLIAGLLLGWLVGAGQARKTRAGMMLASAIGNNGNMGLPISFFAFGEMGLALATVYYAISSFLSNTVGVVVASAGNTTLLQALAHSLRAPVLYAAILGLALNQLHVTIPESIDRAVELMSGAAVPGMLVLLGAQLRNSPPNRTQVIVWPSILIRLVASPLVAWGMCALLGIAGLERQVLILQAAMPTAVMTTVLATEFDTAPGLVATAVFASTLGSLFTISLVLSLMVG
jgi:predicted permease